MNYSPANESIEHLSAIKGKRILYGVMDWGLGHATRSVPLIRCLAENNEVVLASAGRAADFLRQYFPDLPIKIKPAYRISYSKSLPVSTALLLRIPSIFRTIRNEKKWLDELENERSFDLVISDNCYGLFSKKAFSVLITHQLMLKMPRGFSMFERFAHRKIKQWINAFNECWVPDHSSISNNLSGDLSHKYPVDHRVKYIGPLSRFDGKKLPATEKDLDVMYLISGPEPSRNHFFMACLNEAITKKYKAVIVSGVPGPLREEWLGEIKFYNHLPDERMMEFLNRAERIVCRSGYSTIMDLHVLGLKAFYIPTPGQTEQEYLAKHLQDQSKLSRS